MCNCDILYVEEEAKGCGNGYTRSNASQVEKRSDGGWLRGSERAGHADYKGKSKGLVEGLRRGRRNWGEAVYYASFFTSSL